MSEAQLRASLASDCDKHEGSIDWAFASIALAIKEKFNFDITDDTPWVKEVLMYRYMKEESDKAKKDQDKIKSKSNRLR